MKPLSDLVVHPASRRLLEAVQARMPHALLLTGEPGVGLKTIAQAVTTQKESSLYIVAPTEKNTISIDTIRELYQHTRTRRQHQYIIIDNADTMTHAAQNALLKLLEEPQSSFSFILTSHTPQKLLRTITSRTQHITCHPVDTATTDKILDMLGITNQAKRTQLHFIAPGRPAEIHRLVTDEAYFAAQAAIMKDTKAWLQGSTYEKILIIQKYGNSREEATSLLQAASIMLRFSLLNTPQKHFAVQLNAVQEALDKIAENRHVKLQLLRTTQG